MPAEFELDNILVNQKNNILILVNDRRFEEALMALHLLSELWIACNYEYKIHEIEARIRKEIQESA